MDNLEIRRYEMFRRVRDFGVMYAADFLSGSLGNELFATLTSVVAGLEQQGASQSSGRNKAMEGTASKAVIRAALIEDLTAINRTARALAYETPGLDNKFRMPRKVNDQALVAAARAFAADAAPLTAAFLRHEMPTDFLATLNGRIASFEEALTRRTEAKATHVSATAAIDEFIERGMTAVQRLDVIVRNKYASETAVLAAWETASHTERAARSASAGTGNGNTTPATDQ